jgi:hypothetical protein
MRAFVCSRDDVVTRLEWEDGSAEAQPVLEGVPVRCVAADGDRVIVGTQGAGVLVSSDGAAWSVDGRRSWSAADAGRELGYCWALAADPGDPDRWYVSAAPGPRQAHSAGRAYGRVLERE